MVKLSDPIPQGGIAVYKNIQPDLKVKLKNVLLAMDYKNSEHKDILDGIENGFEGWKDAKDTDYDVIRVLIRSIHDKDYFEYGPKTVKVGILPRYSTITLFGMFEPLMKYLSKNTGYDFKLIIPKDFDSFVDMVNKGEVDFSYENPYVYVQIAKSKRGYAFVKTIKQDKRSEFRGIIITREDSNIHDINDLLGKRIMIVSFRSAGGYLLQKELLLNKGMILEKNFKVLDGKHQENVIINVYNKDVEGGFVRESALSLLKYELDLNRIKIINYTSYIPTWPMTAFSHTDRSLVEKVKKLLLDLDLNNPVHAKILSAARVLGFTSSHDSDYEIVRKMVDKVGAPY